MPFTTDCHSFHDCPLRSSSLLIVNKEKQTIVTATDEVFDILGYDPTQLVGKSINLLNPRRQYYYDDEKKKKEQRFTLVHDSLGQIPFEICIHHDPLTNATDLDYWLIRPMVVQQKATLTNTTNTTIHTRGPVTILRLSPFGTIEHAYPSTQFPQQSHELQGHPIMSFVHESDVRSLCEILKSIRRRTYHTFRVRWLNLLHPKVGGEEENFKWVSFTVLNSPRRQSCDFASDPQSRPICIIRPIYEEQHTKQQQASTNHTYLIPYLLTGLVSGTVKLLWEGTSLGVNSFYELMQALHTALDQGKTYLVEYFAHLLTHAMKMINEVVYIPPWEEYQKAARENYSDEDRVEGYSNTCRAAKQREEEEGKVNKLDGLSSIKVSVDDNSIWSVPLFINKTITKNYLTAAATNNDKVCSKRRNQQANHY